MTGHLHLIEKFSNFFKPKDRQGLYASGFWDLSEAECSDSKYVQFHDTKAKASFYGGVIETIVPASTYADEATKRGVDPEGRWVLVFRPDPKLRNQNWEGESHAMAYKSLV